MATTNKGLAAQKSTAVTMARVLSDIGHLGAKVGEIIAGDTKAITALANAGLVDDHPDAVEYANSQGANVVELTSVEAAMVTSTARIEENAQNNQAPPDTGGTPDAGAGNEADNNQTGKNDQAQT